MDKATQALNTAEMGTIFQIAHDGTFHQEDGLVPEALDYYGDPNELDGLWGGWQAVAGLSAQHGYAGPIMHPSEVMSASALHRLFQGRTGPLWVALVPVVDVCHPEAMGYGEAIGWAVLIHHG